MMRRKLVWICLGLLVLACVCIAGGIVVVHATPLPRILTEYSLEKMLDTRVRIQRLDTAWSTRSQLKGVQITLPTEDSQVVTIDSVDVTHNHLLYVLIGQLELSTLEAEGFSLQRSDEPGAAVLRFDDARATVEIDRNSGGKDSTALSVRLEEERLGQVSADITINDKQVSVRELSGSLLGGTVDGSAVLQADWKQTRIALSWTGVDLRALSPWLPESADRLGVAGGELIVAPAEQAHPLEPLAFSVSLGMDEGIYVDAGLGRIEITGVVGEDRLLLTDVHVPVFGGTVQGRVRLSRQENVLFGYLNCTFKNIDVNRAAQAFRQEPVEIVGKLSGSGHVVSSPAMDDMSGTLNLSLEESNLAGSRVIGTLYNTLNLNMSGSEPQGYGRTKLQFVGSKLHIPEFYYYNRGVEIWGRGTILNLPQGKHSPVKGVVLATTRPLKDINLPGVDTLDKIMFFAQKNAASVELGGTLGDIQVNVAALPEVRSFLKKLLGGGDK